MNTPYWEAVKELTQFLSNNSQWYPYDVSCNLIQHTHHTRIHVDCVNEEVRIDFSFIYVIFVFMEAARKALISQYI